MVACGADCQCYCNCITLRSKIVMEKKTNVDFIAKENLDFISELFKKEESASSPSTPDKLERLRIEAREAKRKIMPGMLVYDNQTPSLPLYPANKEGCCVLCKAEIQILKEQIEQFLQRKDECKPLHLEETD